MIDILTVDLTTIIMLYKKIGFLEAKKSWLQCKFVNRVSDRLKVNYNILQRTYGVLSKHINQLSVMFDDVQVDEFIKYCEEQKSNSRLMEEIEIEKRNRPGNVKLDSMAVVNSTDIDIPVDIQLVFSWGQKFMFPHILKTGNMWNFLAQIEHTVYELVHPAAIDQTMIQVKNVIKEQDLSIRDCHTHWLMFIKQRTDDFLKLHEDIKPIPSDKGKVTIVMYLQDYVDRMIDHLSNLEHYIPQDFDPIMNLASREQRLIQHLRMNDKTRKFTKPYESKCMILPKMYGNIKTHKDNKIRPITSNSGNTVGAQLNSILNEMLTRIFPVKSRHILNSSEMKNFIDNTVLPEEHILVSFDAVSMFTNIPTGLILKIVNKNLKSFKDNFDLDGRFVMSMFHFILNECSFFSSLGKIYKQKSGLPMGGAISPLCCRLIMDEVIESLDIQPFFIKVYVDDTLAAVKKEDIEPMLAQLNRFHRNLKFTVEVEKDLRINFLNMTIFRNDQELITNWYKKPYASLRLLNYFSAHKKSIIYNTATQFIKTVLELSDGIFFAQNKGIIFTALQNNCFPEIEIMKLMQSYTLMKPIHVTERKVNKPYVSVPYCNTGYNLIAKVIKSNMQEDYQTTESVRDVKINPIMNIKDFTPLGDRSNMIVQMYCSCQSKIKIQVTGFNQTAADLINEMVTTKQKCDKFGHAFKKHKIIRGLKTRNQTKCYLKYLQYKFQEKLNDKLSISLPNKYFKSLL